MRYNQDAREEHLLDILREDKLGRSKFMQALVGIIGSSDGRALIDVDGSWGSGKTVVAKSLKLLSTETATVNGIDKNTIAEYRDNYDVMYYNAWENDVYEPAESLILQLANHFWGDSEKWQDHAMRFIKAALQVFVKIQSSGAVSVEDFRGESYLYRLIAGAKLTEDKQKAVDDLIYNGLSDDKKLLLIVDELDRCRPTFAVRLLEILQHYFTSDRVVILLFTNNSQLVYTVEKYYGQGFNAYGYLDKIFDLVVDLPRVEPRLYVERLVDLQYKHAPWINDAISAAAEYYDMSLREIDRLCLLVNLLKNQLDVAPSSFRRNAYMEFAERVTVPFMLGAKIKDAKSYERLRDGRGEKDVESICTESLYARDSARNIIGESSVGVSTLYREVATFGREDKWSSEIATANELLKNVVSLLGFTK